MNTIDLKRQSPKKKRERKGKCKAKGQEEYQTIRSSLGIGGKVGKPCFIVLVGEVQHLYKTTKSTQNIPCNASTWGLHGCIIEEVVDRLDGNL